MTEISSESTPEKPSEADAARHGTQPGAEPASTEGDTPEERLLARKGSAQYLADVRALIAERDEWRDAAEQVAAELADRRRVPMATREELSVGQIWSRRDERDL